MKRTWKIMLVTEHQCEIPTAREVASMLLLQIKDTRYPNDKWTVEDLAAKAAETPLVLTDISTFGSPELTCLVHDLETDGSWESDYARDVVVNYAFDIDWEYIREREEAKRWKHRLDKWRKENAS